MTWLFVILGMALLLLGIWGGPQMVSRSKTGEKSEDGQATGDDPWRVLTEPIQREEELIQIPEHKPWYMPGRDRRFQQGLAVGLGAGLLITGIVVAFTPTHREEAQPPSVVQAEPPDTPAPEPATEPETTPEPPEPPAPTNVSFEVRSGQMPPEIAARLRAAGLVDDARKFLSRVQERGVETRLKAGKFTIPSNASVDEIIDILIS